MTNPPSNLFWSNLRQCLAAIWTISAVITALFRDQIMSKVFKPKILLSCYQKLSETEDDEDEQHPKELSLMIKLKNEWNNIAKNCICYIKTIQKKQSNWKMLLFRSFDRWIKVFWEDIESNSTISVDKDDDVVFKIASINAPSQSASDVWEWVDSPILYMADDKGNIISLWSWLFHISISLKGDNIKKQEQTIEVSWDWKHMKNIEWDLTFKII